MPSKRAQKGPRRDPDITERRRKAFELKLAGKTYRDIGEELNCNASTAYRLVAEETAHRIPQEDVDTVRRIELDRIDKLIARWMKPALGEVTVPFITRDGDAIDIPIPIDESLKATNAVMGLIDKKWKWSGLEKAELVSPVLDVDAAKADDLNAELRKLIEKTKAAEAARAAEEAAEIVKAAEQAIAEG